MMKKMFLGLLMSFALIESSSATNDEHKMLNNESNKSATSDSDEEYFVPDFMTS